MLEIALHYIDHGWSVRPYNGNATLVRGSVHATTPECAIIGWWFTWLARENRNHLRCTGQKAQAQNLGIA